MATYTVKSGDTISQIAKRLGVSPSAISGYKSGDPNLITPGEQLSIQTADASGSFSRTPVSPQSAIEAIAPRIQPSPVSITPGMPGLVTDIPPGGPKEAPEAPLGPQALRSVVGTHGTAPTTPVVPVVTEKREITEQPITRAPEGPVQTAETVPVSTTSRTPSGAVVDTTTGEIVSGPNPEAIFGQFGVPADAIEAGFQINPQGTLSDLVRVVMEATGLPDVSQNIRDISSQIETLENERDAELASIEDDPFVSAGSKAQRIERVSQKYENKIRNRVNRLTLLQDAYQNARQQAQFAATTAVGLYDRERAFQQNQLEMVLEQAEKVAQAERKLDEPLSVAEAKSLGVPFGTTARQAYGRTAISEQGTRQQVPFIPSGVSAEGGDFASLLASTRGGKLPNQVETIRPIQKSVAVINQLESLQETIQKSDTGPFIGFLQNINPYSFDARAVQAQLQAIVPNLARGIYGEVGVLTDQDIRNYIKTLPNLQSTREQNEFVTAMTLKTAQRNFESQLETLASAGYDVSRFSGQYEKMKSTVESIEKKLGIGTAQVVDSDDEAIFDSVLSVPSEKRGYLQNLWSALMGE